VDEADAADEAWVGQTVAVTVTVTTAALAHVGIELASDVGCKSTPDGLAVIELGVVVAAAAEEVLASAVALAAAVAAAETEADEAAVVAPPVT